MAHYRVPIIFRENQYYFVFTFIKNHFHVLNGQTHSEVLSVFTFFLISSKIKIAGEIDKRTLKKHMRVQSV